LWLLRFVPGNTGRMLELLLIIVILLLIFGGVGYGRRSRL
jgi:hypothetical protein